MTQLLTFFSLLCALLLFAVVYLSRALRNSERRSNAYLEAQLQHQLMQLGDAANDADYVAPLRDEL